MGRIKARRVRWAKMRVKGLRRRWMLNALGVTCALGLVCVLAVVLAFSMYWYSGMETEMRNRAEDATKLFSEYSDQSFDHYYQSCIAYTQTFAGNDTTELQFINARGYIVASSAENGAGKHQDVSDIVAGREIAVFTGEDPQTGKRIMAVSSPMICGSGEVVGVLRYVSTTEKVDGQILMIGAVSLLSLLVVLAVVLISSKYYIRSILVPLAEIIDKSNKIANGSYGIQIQTRYDDEIGELADTINELSNQISQNEKMQSEFISSLSHELRTPLTAITGWSETLLTSGSLDADTRRGMRIIQKETERLTEMVVELLDFTRIQDGKMTLNMELTDLRAEFEDTVYMYGSRLAQDGITLAYQDSDEEIPEILCDPQRLRQVFLNILDNAAKHGADGKKIDAFIALEGDTVAVQIRDYGPGIPEDELPLVKKKFYKGSSKARGTGIGLAVCDEIVGMHGGQLLLENAQGGGTVVTVRLPISQ